MWYLVATITSIIISFALSESKGAVVVRQTHHERLDYPIILCNQVLVSQENN